ncbi:copper resistance-associated p-type atpase [Colletotrichum sojae]|uniref:Copper resistance-associated p-type atpase n=1 Tax=Colletotrichum sojae TaxID=2175907 RepID=A0A8H6MKK1_9PEZI|nr:copper resistance-associated p-type atpase [Colletotrichum sojae]
MLSKKSRSKQATRETTFLVPNIHCLACTGFIEPLLRELRPAPTSIVTSIINHSVTVEHDPALSPRKVSRALSDAGYDVDSIITGPRPRDPESGPRTVPADDNSFSTWIERLVQRFSGGGGALNEEERQKRHAEHCQQCREGIPTDAEKWEDLSVVVVGDSSANNLHQAILSIVGMSCSACVGNITNALETKPWVKSVNVGLLTRAATIEFFDEANTNELVDIINSLGYDATLEEVEEVAGAAEVSGPADDIWQASLSIGGMTCSSCVGAVTEALESLSWTRSVNVNLVSSSATVVFQDKSHLNAVISAVEDLGYTAALSDVTQVNRNAAPKDSRQTLSIRVDGMYCAHCPGKVLDALGSFGDRLVVDKPGTTDSPFFAVSYIPQAPDFTIRAILQAISDADEDFKPAVYHPPTVEERSRQMLQRTRRHLFLRVLLSFMVAIPALIIGIVYMNLVPSDNPGRRYLMEPLKGVSRAEWSLLVMATPVYFFAADVFHRRTIKELCSLWRPGSPIPLLRRLYRFGSMDMLVSFATTVAYFSSIAEIAIAATNAHAMYMDARPSHMDAVVFLTLFLLAGRMIEAYSKAKTGEAVSRLGSLRPREALLLQPGENGDMQASTVNIDLLDTGDLVRVVHGGSPPWDGILLEGDAEFVESALTGESRPVFKQLGDPIYAGTVNKGGPITMRITGASGDSLLDQIIKVVREGQARRAPIERVADTITGYFVPVVTLIAIVTWLTWLGLGLTGKLPEDYKDSAVGGWPFWSLQFAIAVFVIACPCGIGLAAPTALFVGGGLAAKYGILAKGGGEAFQEASNLDIIVFDKTGTLTEGGEPKLTDYKFLVGSAGQNQGWTEDTILGCLGELEGNSSHPVAKAVATFCNSRSSANFKIERVKEIPGKGIKGTLIHPSLPHAVEILAGNEALMGDHDVVFDSSALQDLDSWKDQAKSVVLAAGKPLIDEDTQWVPLAVFAVSDALRPEAKPVLATLRKQGIDVWMISGDNVKTANAVGAMVGIPQDRIIAGVLPEQKAEKVQYLQKSQVKQRGPFDFGKDRYRRPTVAMVGDGVNDSPALTVADVGIAIGSGSDVAISAAEFVLINSDLTTLLTLSSLSRAVFRRVKFNFAWALVYNLVALPVAAGVLYPIKTNGNYTRLDPVWAALVMALSSLSVITSSLLLRARLPLVGYRNQTRL